ncbi:SDR family NAD(P)-dependent oxidoreductase [Paenibacillus motobuensis]|uniref:SDR family NAD(P)-dependent oxidoreductase n=1 Tax=Paenibacillus TaxID=44249 RepID=UPI0020426879|nr:MULTISPECIES: SDR family NAD(P)-dependent oxidoreductase [Paenibacillus]MCM3039976.1 SDR family NAD(P)-dependent oxidoreductase [Paenibacillus lutimineralis]MCM3647080.1 SDR family NAD(P)-dependent oxidoreductase [Paenibacillus motobuensis]
MELRGKKALVTGGGTGIGRAVSLMLADRGCSVAVNYSRSVNEAEETVRIIQSQGGRALAIQADVAHEDEVLAMVDTLANEWNGIDLLVNNASVTRHIQMNDLDAVTDDAWDELFQINVKGMFYVARAIAPYMIKQKKGAIVNVGSIAGITGSGSSLPYAVSKAAVHGLTRSLARSLAPYIRVNCIAPGAVMTRWWEGRQQQMEELAGSLLLGETALPADIAHMICAVLEQEALAGQIITVDAGQTM